MTPKIKTITRPKGLPTKYKWMYQGLFARLVACITKPEWEEAGYFGPRYHSESPWILNDDEIPPSRDTPAHRKASLRRIVPGKKKVKS